MASKKEQIIQAQENLGKVNEGLKDQISYRKELDMLAAKANRMQEREFKFTKDVLDKTKSIFENRRSITEETMTSVDLHKLERKLIAEGLEDQVKIVQKLKDEERIQKRINSVVNQQVKAYSSIGNKIDDIVKGIPGVGGMLSAILGTDNLGQEMGEELRTAFSGPNGVMSFMREAGAEATGGFLNNFLTLGGGKGNKGGVSRARHRLAGFFAGPGPVLVASTALFSMATKMGMKDGMQSVGVLNTLKRTFFGGAFEGLRDAFGHMGQADIGTLLRMQMNRLMFGISGGDQAKVLAAQVNISGLTKQQALNVQSQVASFAAMNAVLPSKVFEDMASNTEMFAKYAKDGGLNLGMAAVKARQLGIDLSTVDKIADSVLNFQSSIEAELSASLLTGKQLNLNRARELALMGDIAGLQDEILKQVGSEAELQQMNVIARKKLADAFGITVSELSRLASGEMEIKNSDMKQNTQALRNLTIATAVAAGFYGGKTIMGGIQFMHRKMQTELIRRGALTQVAGTGAYSTARSAMTGGKFNPDLHTIARGSGGVRNVRIVSNPKAMGLTSMAGIARGGPIALAVAAVLGIPMILNSIKKNTEKSATNSTKSVVDRNQLISATVLQHGK